MRKRCFIRLIRDSRCDAGSLRSARRLYRFARDGNGYIYALQAVRPEDGTIHPRVDLELARWLNGNHANHHSTSQRKKWRLANIEGQ